MSRSERLLLRGFAALALVLRAIAYFRYRFDSDEQQHLHVAWGWSDGLVQYRDLFDNHVPLFHLLSAPLVALFGERNDILLWMRAPMLLLFAFVVYATWRIGIRLYDERVAAWAVVVLILFPPFFLKSLEYRTDNLWTALWLGIFLVVSRGAVNGGAIEPLTSRASFLTGLLAGAAFSTSLKTIPLGIAFGAAALVTAFVIEHQKRLAIRAVPAAVGFLAVPVVLLCVFAALHALPQLYYCTITFNEQLSKTRGYVWTARALFPVSLAAIAFVAWRMRSAPPLRFLFALACGIYVSLLASFWILISPRDFLPVMPIAAIFLAAALVRSQWPLRGMAVVPLIFAASLFYYANGFQNGTAWHTTMLNQALHLTKPGEMLMDLKGETIFRRRPFYYVFENITRAQMAKGVIADTLAEDVIRTRTHVAQADGPLWPPRSRAFLSANFLDMGRLRASGQWLQPDGSFTIAVPGDYVILDEHGQVRGTLDAMPYSGPRALAAGPHRFTRASGTTKLAVLWAPAFERGFSPFHHRDKEF